VAFIELILKRNINYSESSKFSLHSLFGCYSVDDEKYLHTQRIL